MDPWIKMGLHKQLSSHRSFRNLSEVIPHRSQAIRWSSIWRVTISNWANNPLTTKPPIDSPTEAKIETYNQTFLICKNTKEPLISKWAGKLQDLWLALLARQTQFLGKLRVPIRLLMPQAITGIIWISWGTRAMQFQISTKRAILFMARGTFKLEEQRKQQINNFIDGSNP